MKESKKIFQAKGNQKKQKSGRAILVSDKIHFKLKVVKRDKVGHSLMIKGSILQKYSQLFYLYAPNIEASKCIKQVLLQLDEINSNTIVVGYVNILLSKMGKSVRKQSYYRQNFLYVTVRSLLSNKCRIYLLKHIQNIF